MIIAEKLTLRTKGHTDIVDLTPELQRLVAKHRLQEGFLNICIVGSTAAVTTIEYEPGLIETDLPELLNKLAPYGKDYAHNETWGDDNGAAHLRASLIGSSQTVPVSGGSLMLGTWQQVIVLDFDTRTRSRSVVVQLFGEE